MELPQISVHRRMVLEMLPKLQEFRSKRLFDVVVLKAGDTEILSHRSLLFGMSPYFLDMFTHELMESQQRMIEIKDIPGHALSSIIDFAYTRNIELTVDNVKDILSVSSLLQVHEIQNLCCSFLMKQLDISNCLGIKTFVEANGCPQEVTSDIDKFVCCHFQQVAMGVEFLNSSAENVSSLILSLDLKVSSEEVCSAVLEWVKQDPEERNPHIPTLFSHIRLPMLSMSYLMEKVGMDVLIREQQQCRDLLDKVKRHHLLPHQWDIRSPIPHFHPHKNTVGILYAVVTIPCLSKLRAGIRVAVLGHQIFVTGGNDKTLTLDSVEFLDFRMNTCQTVSSMGSARTLSNQLIAVGGINGPLYLKSTELYNPVNNLWEDLMSM